MKAYRQWLDDDEHDEERSGWPPIAPGKVTLTQRLVRATAARGFTGPSAPLPFLDEIQRAFGAAHDVSHVRAHVGGLAAESAGALEASAYASGSDVAFSAAPDLRTAAHEAAHVVQQGHGVTLDGGLDQPGDVHEQHADRVADAVVRGESAAPLLAELPASSPAAADAGAPVQRSPGPGGPGGAPLSPLASELDRLRESFAKVMRKATADNVFKAPLVAHLTKGFHAHLVESAPAPPTVPLGMAVTTYQGTALSGAPPTPVSTSMWTEAQIHDALDWAIDVKKVGKGGNAADWTWSLLDVEVTRPKTVSEQALDYAS